MNTLGLWLVFLRWWRAELVRALLWGVWVHVLARRGGAQDRAFDRFTRLVEATDCFPCYVSFCHPARNVPDLETGRWCPSLVVVGDEWEDYR